MNKFKYLVFFLGVFCVSFAQAQNYSECNQSLIYEYNLQDAIDKHNFDAGVEYYCSGGVNHILRRAKNIMKNDASQFYSLQIATLDKCLQNSVNSLNNMQKTESEKKAIYFVLENEIPLSAAYGQDALFVKMGSKKVSVVMDDTHEVGNHINGGQAFPEYEIDQQDFMNLSSISQNLDTLLCTKGPRA
ncbi:hypothetical protein MRY82_01685 [bacterium]|nr:hypothetical protein [bacterium]